jgi:prepilin peptidase CpaA
VALASLLMLGAWSGAVAVSDIRRRRVPNWLVLVGFACAIVQQFGVLQIAPVSLSQALIGAGLAFAVFIPLYAFRAMGAADVKVFAVLGLWFGASVLLPVWMIASALAGVHALYAIARPRMAPMLVFGRVLMFSGAVGQPVRGAPYAAFLVIAACAVALSRVFPSLTAGFGG